MFGNNHSLVLSQTFIASLALIKGNTAFLPPHIEYRLTLAFNTSYVDVGERRILFVEPSRGTHRTDVALGVQEAFIDYHLRNVSTRFDFDDIRVGIQPFQFDFRGFLFQDQQLGIRLFGDRDDNRFQYNIEAIWRLEKDTNSGLNNILQTPRRDWILHANAFRQDFPVVGLTSLASVTYNMNRERGHIEVDDNGFPGPPRFVRQSAGARLRRLLRRLQRRRAYRAAQSHRHRLRPVRLGTATMSSPADRPKIRAFFAAAEPSIDFNWIRIRASALFASGDNNPYDDTEHGFDAIFENPIFAGADTSYWIRQTIPFAGGARAVGINGRNGILNSLRSSKEQGQSNFANRPATAF